NVLEVAIDEGRLVELVALARQERPGIADFEKIASVICKRESGPSFRQRFIDQVASLFELLSYEVERGRIVAGQPLDLFLTLRVGGLVYHQAVACQEHEVGSNDVSRLSDSVRVLQREEMFRNTHAVLVCRVQAPPEVHAFADLQNVDILKQSELEARLLDGRSYASRLIERCQVDTQYPVGLYVVPHISSGVQDTDRPAIAVADEWLNEHGLHLLAVLGDVGTGKTFFARMTALRIAQ